MKQAGRPLYCLLHHLYKQMIQPAWSVDHHEPHNVMYRKRAAKKGIEKHMYFLDKKKIEDETVSPIQWKHSIALSLSLLRFDTTWRLNISYQLLYAMRHITYSLSICNADKHKPSREKKWIENEHESEIHSNVRSRIHSSSSLMSLSSSDGDVCALCALFALTCTCIEAPRQPENRYRMRQTVHTTNVLMECYSSSLPLYMDTNTYQRFCCCCCCYCCCYRMLICWMSLYTFDVWLYAFVYVIIHSYSNGGSQNTIPHSYIRITHWCLQSFQRPTT